jgi:hypothetical protein
MPTPTWTRIVIFLAAVVWLVVCLISDSPVDQGALRALGISSSVVVLLLLGFDYWLWRWFPQAITKRPLLDGTWKARLDYEAGGGGIESKDCFMVIRQTYSDISVCMLFDISSSQSNSAGIALDKGRCSLWFSYWSSAETLAREGNAPHRGAAELIVSRKPKIRLEGDYWTERKTKGKIMAEARSKHHYDDFASASAGDYS